MIPQAIWCAICGAEKNQTNHWFVTSEQGGELRVSGWNSRMRLRAGSKPLCGQTCLHKLVDEFVARNLASRTATEGAIEERPVTDTSLTSRTAYAANKAGTSTNARAVAVVSAKPLAVPVPVVLPIPSVIPADEPRLPPGPLIESVPNDASRRWRADAWERERALHAAERRSENGTRHRQTL